VRASLFTFGARAPCLRIRQRALRAARACTRAAGQMEKPMLGDAS
jgi:hypothetical protein